MTNDAEQEQRSKRLPIKEPSEIREDLDRLACADAAQEAGGEWTRTRLNSEAHRRTGMRSITACLTVALEELNVQSATIARLKAEREQANLALFNIGKACGWDIGKPEDAGFGPHGGGPRLRDEVPEQIELWLRLWREDSSALATEKAKVKELEGKAKLADVMVSRLRPKLKDVENVPPPNGYWWRELELAVSDAISDYDALATATPGAEGDA